MFKSMMNGQGSSNSLDLDFSKRSRSGHATAGGAWYGGVTYPATPPPYWLYIILFFIGLFLYKKVF